MKPDKIVFNRNMDVKVIPVSTILTDSTNIIRFRINLSNTYPYSYSLFTYIYVDHGPLGKRNETVTNYHARNKSCSCVQIKKIPNKHQRHPLVGMVVQLK
jgi:hypothetical protein